MTDAADLAPQTRRSSELSSRSAEVFAEAENHLVTVTRRDGEALVLMSQREADGRARLLALALQLITVALDGSGSLPERMAKAFPWMLALPVGGRTGRCWARMARAERGRGSLLNRPENTAQNGEGSDGRSRNIGWPRLTTGGESAKMNPGCVPTQVRQRRVPGTTRPEYRNRVRRFHHHPARGVLMLHS